MRILVADDEAIICKLFSRVLSAHGHEVTIAADGVVALEAVMDCSPDLIVTDWMMPNMTGVELCREVRRLGALPPPHIIMVTSLSPSEHILEAFRAGADDFVAKPVDAREVLARVTAATTSMLKREEAAFRKILDVTQEALDEEDEALLGALREITMNYRKQRAFTRCRAFLRRQVAIAERRLGVDAPQTQALRTELQELDGQTEELPCMAS